MLEIRAVSWESRMQCTRSAVSSSAGGFLEGWKVKFVTYQLITKENPPKTLGSVREQFLFCMKPGGRVAVLKPFPPRNVI